MRHEVQWVAPAPLWPEAAAGASEDVRRALRRPALLRFAGDDFMDELMALIEHDAPRLGEYLARPETWRTPTPAPSPVERGPEFVRKISRLRLAADRKVNQLSGLTPAKVQASGAASSAIAAASIAAATQPLKLYQPAHQRFYLVTACLVCRLPGLPDRALYTAREERVGYVIRRLWQKPVPQGQPANPIREYAFVVTQKGSGWQETASAPESLVANEELLPLFAMNFDDADGRRRRLYGGMSPVGRREAYMGAGTFTPATNGTSAPNTTKRTERKIHFRMQVTEPWKNLLRTADDARKTLQSITTTVPGSPEEAAKLLAEASLLKKTSREPAQVLSWYILLDFAKYLRRYAPDVWAAVMSGGEPTLPADTPLAKLYAALNVDMKPSPALVGALQSDFGANPPPVAASMRDALKRIGKPDPQDPSKLYWESRLDGVTTAYARVHGFNDPSWPDFLFALADLEFDAPLPPSVISGPTPGDESDLPVEPELPNPPTPPDVIALAAKQSLIDKLVALVVRTLPADSTEAVPPAPLASRPVLDTREGTFIIRCVYERPSCGPLDPPLMSEPSAQFQLASFFDPEAPARPIRIALPIDTSPAGLRKFDKNTAFMISDQLCGQMQRLKGITFGDLVLSVLPWPFHKDLSVGAPEVGPCRDNSGASLGMICTLSIPIITICALVLLFVIVLLLDLIFHWIPFFIMCFPLPGFKGKRG
jgi:hypothetical protein